MMTVSFSRERQHLPATWAKMSLSLLSSKQALLSQRGGKAHRHRLPFFLVLTNSASAWDKGIDKAGKENGLFT